MRSLLRGTGSLALVCGLVLMMGACDTPQRTTQQTADAPFQPSAVGYDGYMVVVWGRPTGAAEDAVVVYETRYRRLEPDEAWRHHTTDKLQVRFDVAAGSYEAQVRAMIEGAGWSKWWWPEPVIAYVD